MPELTGMDLSRRLLLALAAAAPFGACARTPSAPLATATATDGHPHVVVPVTIAGREVLAVLDNGAPVSSLDAAFAAEAGLSPIGALASGRPTLGTTPIMLGGAEFPAEVLIDDLTELTIATERPIAALVGMDLFRAYAVGVSAGEAVRLYPATPFAPPVGARALRLVRAARGEPSAGVRIDGVEARGIVDLGCSAPLLVSQTFAAERGIGVGRQRSTRLAIVLTNGVLSASDSALTSVAAVSFGGHEFADVPVNLMPDEPGPFADYDLVIGAPLLTKFDLVFDLPETIWLAPSPRQGEPFERRLTGIGAKPVEGGLLIRHIAAGSPAQAEGLAVGDVIAAIDGQAPTLAALRPAAEGQVVMLTLTSGREVGLTAARHY